jgi:hypothetical protein
MGELGRHQASRAGFGYFGFAAELLAEAHFGFDFASHPPTDGRAQFEATLEMGQSRWFREATGKSAHTPILTRLSSATERDTPKADLI